MEDVGEFDSNIATAGNQDRLGQLCKVKGFIGADAKFMAR